MATDEEIATIIERGEAGIAELLRAYDAAEAQYIAAAAQVPTEPVLSVTTSSTTDQRALR